MAVDFFLKIQGLFQAEAISQKTSLNTRFWAEFFLLSHEVQNMDFKMKTPRHENMYTFLCAINHKACFLLQPFAALLHRVWAVNLDKSV